jgi:hypothetical protein
MELRFLINKSLRRVSLLCGFPRLKENYIRRKAAPPVKFARLNMDTAKDVLLNSIKPEELSEIRKRVEDIRKGNLHIFCEPPVKRKPGVFLSHPRTGRQEPLAPWTRMRIKNTGHDQDIKLLWEVNRLGDLDPLMLLAIWENRSEDLKTAHDIVSQWNSENPSGMGVNWFSNMEVALRLLRLLFLKGVMDAFDFKAGLVNSLIAEHTVHVRADWKASRRAMKGGNHLLVELAALAAHETLTGVSGPGCPELEKEMKRQFHEDGGYFEGSLGYHLYVVNVLVFVQFLCSLANKQSPVVRGILEKAIGFAEALSGPDGTIPRIGDWDEGHVFAPVLTYPAKIRSMLALGRSLLPSEKHVIKNEVVREFPQSQMAGWRTNKGELVVFRAANVDFGHSHLDMLSLHYLGQNGPVILDGGTFQYNYSKEKRNEYRGLSAHSTIIAEGLWPVRPLLTFSWQGKLSAVIETGHDWVKGSYSAGKGVYVQRTVQFHDQSFTVFDACQGPYNFWSQFIVPQAIIDQEKVLIHDFQGEHKLTIYPQADIAPKINKKLFSDCYGMEKEVCAVLFPVHESLAMKIVY